MPRKLSSTSLAAAAMLLLAAVGPAAAEQIGNYNFFRAWPKHVGSFKA